MPDSPAFPHRLGALLRDHRGERRQADVADAAGVAVTTYSDYERGNILPSLPVLFTLVRVLSIDPDALLALLDDDPEPANGKAA